MLFLVFSLDLLVRREHLQPLSFNPDFFVFILGCQPFKLIGDEQHLQKEQSDTAAAEALNLFYFYFTLLYFDHSSYTLQTISLSEVCDVNVHLQMNS